MIRIPRDALPVATVDLGDAEPAELHVAEPRIISRIRRGMTVTEDGVITSIDRVRVDSPVESEIRLARLLEADGAAPERVAAMRAACLIALPRPLMRLSADARSVSDGAAWIVLRDSDGDWGGSRLMTISEIRELADTMLTAGDDDQGERLATACALDLAAGILSAARLKGWPWTGHPFCEIPSRKGFTTMSILTVRWQVRFDDGDPLVELAYLPVPFLSDREFLRLTPAERRRFFDLALRVVDTMPTTTVFDGELCRDRLLATAAAAGL